MSDAGSVVVITGGTRGIGLAIAERFASEGQRVAVCARRSSSASGLPDGFMALEADVRQRAQLQRAARQVVERWGRLDVWINAAGVSRWRNIEEVDDAFLEEVLETNIRGTLWGCAVAAELMHEGGVIINISSLAGKRGSAGNSVYCASKFAVNGITQALAKELGGRGIRVNAVCPVYVETEHILEALHEPAAPPRGAPVATYLAEFARTQTALGRLPRIEDVAEAVHWLAGPGAGAITGQCINVDCGTLPQ